MHLAYGILWRLAIISGSDTLTLHPISFIMRWVLRSLVMISGMCFLGQLYSILTSNNVTFEDKMSKYRCNSEQPLESQEYNNQQASTTRILYQQ